jgi:hypothetical protein
MDFEIASPGHQPSYRNQLQGPSIWPLRLSIEEIVIYNMHLAYLASQGVKTLLLQETCISLFLPWLETARKVRFQGGLARSRSLKLRLSQS